MGDLAPYAGAIKAALYLASGVVCYAFLRLIQKSGERRQLVKDMKKGADANADFIEATRGPIPRGDDLIDRLP